MINDNLKAVKATMEIGKSFGDAFAWFFYRGNFTELVKHFQHQPTGLYVVETGGIQSLRHISGTAVPSSA
ncbi:MAG: hypothetical protein LLF96_07700 [Eubacteriales bacterium]|nr:hypothetical protein [Eubacteriales bacterium]